MKRDLRMARGRRWAGYLLSSLALTGCFDSASNGDYYPGSGDNSVPASPSTYAVGGDVSGTLGKVSVEKVGTLTAAQLASNISTIAAATDSNAASTLVLRNASGGFSATSVTATTFNGALNGNASSASVSTYALGLLGADLNVIGPLGGFAGGDTFRVASVAGNFTGNTMPTTMGSGSRVTLIFSGPSVTLVSDTKLKLKGMGGILSSYRTIASGNDSFTFVFTPGTPAAWLEVARSVGTSHVEASIVSATGIGSSPHSVVYAQTDADLLSEYDNIGGGFTATQGGRYHVAARLTSSATDWTSGDWCRLDAVANIGAGDYLVLSDIHYPTADGAAVASSPCRVALDGTITLPPTASLRFVLTYSRAAAGLGFAIPGSQGTLNNLTISRMP